ncbi:MAG TPA: hypothetical protein VM261_12730 [Kofleriaceae bacterium]|nr:hypothetical protein [Kofleriaceae bacterium]
MRPVVSWVFLVLAACGQVQTFPDGPPGGDGGSDGGDEVDAPTDAKDDASTCGAEVACQNGDDCCPPGCTSLGDTDCVASCDNGAIESGETCDPLNTCPTACPQLGCQLRTLQNAGTCGATCAVTGTQTACVGGDGCCPAGCNMITDSDCGATCGNGVVESGERCDPLSSCPTSCPALGCQLRTLQGAGTCNAQCTAAGMQTSCTNGDGCCPAGCNAVNDTDCAAVCGNGVLEGSERCDPLSSCPTSCPQQGCQLRALTGAGTCNAQCTAAGTQTACASGDLCCPAGCNATNDSDCAPGCGNGVVETGETCDPLSSCPTSCPQQGCQLRTLSGAGTCAARCNAAGTQTACVNGDGCCPGGCNAGNDTDCSPVCGNGVIEGTETCDPLNTCPTSCPQQGCQLRSLSGAGTCNARCNAAGMQTACVSNDGCCPGGCNGANDNDCAPVCGNGVVENGETCDPLTSCPSSCPPLGCQLRALTAAGTCGAACQPAGNQTACINADGCCPLACNAGNDSDCSPVCGNNLVEPGETCDGNCTCPQESDACYTTTGGASTCNLRCHQPVRTCAGGDGCCAFDGSGCSAGNDAECAGPAWQVYTLPRPVNYLSSQQCDVIDLHGIAPGGSYLFTTCSPTGGMGTGDPKVTSVVDASGLPYNVINDDCGDATALPRLAGWSCTNSGGSTFHFCASPTPGGFRVGANAGFLRVTVCPYNDQGGGSSPFYVWYNAPQAPFALQ